MYTEKEASVLLCPKMLDLETADNITTCFGSQCMAWRWDEELSGVLADGTYRKVGYCGLAGKP